jgi:mono/diheme cytochrome c family protein
MRFVRTSALCGLTIAWAAAVVFTAGRDGAAAAPSVPVAPARLSETGLYASGSSAVVAEGNRPYSPQYPLWTDGARKSRWIYLPPGGVIDASNPDDWVFPVGTRLWKEFRFNGRKVETRLLWRATAERWVFATYQWRDDQSDADLAPEDGVFHAAEVAPGRFHTIPGRNDCAACHGAERTGPLGFNAIQLSPDRDPNALHGEPFQEGMATLATLERERLITGLPAAWRTSPPRIAARTPEERALLGYLGANCGTCHNSRGEIGPDAPSMAFADLMRNGDTLLTRLAAHRTMWQAPGQPDGETTMIDRAAPDHSAMLLRMRSRSPSSQMPPLGTVVRDEAAVAALRAWIGGGS